MPRPYPSICLILFALWIVPVVHTARAQTSDKDILREMHAAVLKAHLDGDVEAWMALEADSVLSVNNGVVKKIGRSERSSMRNEYLSTTSFDSYRDLMEPVVRISGDGTLGWVIAEVEVVGWTHRDDGAIEDIGAVYAWIELYDKRDGRWVMTGNVTNSRALD